MPKATKSSSAKKPAAKKPAAKKPAAKKPAVKKLEPGTVGWLIEKLKGLPVNMKIVANSEYDASGGESCPVVKVAKGKLLRDGTFMTAAQAKEMRKDDPEEWNEYKGPAYNKAPEACCILLEGEGNFGFEM